MVKENKSGLMDHDIKDHGKMEKQMAEVNYSMLTVLYTKENLSMIKQKVTDHIHKLTGLTTLDNGKMINNMATAQKHGQTEKFTRERSLKGKSMERGNYRFQMAQSLKVILITMRSMGMGYTSLLTEENIQANQSTV